MRSRLRALLAFLTLNAGCIREPEPPPPPPVAPAMAAPGIYYEENLQPEPTVRLEIIGLDDARDAVSKRVTVTGTLVNRGNRPTSQVSVKVTALDENGDMVLSIAALPSTD